MEFDRSHLALFVDNEYIGRFYATLELLIKPVVRYKHYLHSDSVTACRKLRCFNLDNTLVAIGISKVRKAPEYMQLLLKIRDLKDKFPDGIPNTTDVWADNRYTPTTKHAMRKFKQQEFIKKFNNHWSKNETRTK
jgi:predicted nuclease with TOPRIM domain